MFTWKDPALRVTDTSLLELHKAGLKVTHITPKLGSYISGIQLNQLNDAAKYELAWLIPQRKVLAFHNRDLIHDGPAARREYMRYFGKPNYQPVPGSIKGYLGFHIIQKNSNKEELARFLDQKPTTTLWHQDVSYEVQPPGYVMLGCLQGPDVGGNTVFASTDVAYSRRPLGLKESEQGVLLEFLMQYMVMGHDFQAQVSWAPRSIVMFDNCCTLHTAVVEYINDDDTVKLRRLVRLAVIAEKLIPVTQGN
ncbi:hypothetical protein DL769_007772 [Monosporascus sp. CRB-8-3]|nr:hypothetical protein DL769_007772 [Monosporascus sp. CRB-8-3]